MSTHGNIYISGVAGVIDDFRTTL